MCVVGDFVVVVWVLVAKAIVAAGAVRFHNAVSLGGLDLAVMVARVGADRVAI